MHVTPATSGRGTSAVRREKRPCTSLSAGWKRFLHVSGRDGARTRGASPWAFSHLHIGGPNIYPAWRLRPEYLPSSASCSGVRGGAAFSRRIALSRMGSVCTRIQKKVVSESKLKRKISLRHCIHTGKQALMCQRRAPREWKQACQTHILAVAASIDLMFWERGDWLALSEAVMKPKR